MSVAADSVVLRCPQCDAKNRVPTTGTGRPRCGSCRADLPWLVTADDGTFDDVVAAARRPVLVDVWAPWCGPCRQVAPVVEQVAKEYAGRLKVVKVNADDSPQVSQRHQISGIPTLLLYHDGKEVTRTVGALPAPKLRQWLARELEGITGDR